MVFPAPIFTPADWYWKADDGRIYSSLRNLLVYPYDSAYLSFLSSRGGVTPWPRDATGAQTNQALQDVLASYGIVVTIPRS